MIDTFEYMTAEHSWWDMDNRRLDEILNKHAQKGWRLVNINTRPDVGLGFITFERDIRHPLRYGES